MHEHMCIRARVQRLTAAGVRDVFWSVDGLREDQPQTSSAFIGVPDSLQGFKYPVHYYFKFIAQLTIQLPDDD